jgi:hypothetical protein
MNKAQKTKGSNEMKNLFFKKINKIDKPLGNLIKKSKDAN